MGNKRKGQDAATGAASSWGEMLPTAVFGQHARRSIANMAPHFIWDELVLEVVLESH